MRWQLQILTALFLAGSLSAVSCISHTPLNAKDVRDPSVSAPVRGREHRFQAFAKSWTAMKVENVVMQERDYSCGAAALATLIRYHLGDYVTETQLIIELKKMLTIEELKDRIKKGLTLTDLRRLAVRMGYLASIGKLELDKLRGSKVPLVVGIVVDGYDHFVVYRGMDDYYVYLADPSRGKIRIPITQFAKEWQKNAVLVVVKPGVEPPTSSPLNLHPEDTELGISNEQYLRDRTTTIPAIPFR